jgi:chemotaxis signal transduction protein
MAAVTRVADLPLAVAGLLDVHGDTLAVVDPRPRLGLPAQAAHPAQHLLLLNASRRFLLWVDCIETIVTVDASAIEDDLPDDGPASTPSITRIDGQLVQVLSPGVFDPGQVVQAALGAR